MENNKGNALLIYVLAIFFWIIPSLVFYFGKKDGTEFERENARKSLNFEIVMTIIMVILAVVSPFLPILYIVYSLVALAHFVINIIAAVTVNKGEYPNMFIPLEIIKK